MKLQAEDIKLIEQMRKDDKDGYFESLYFSNKISFSSEASYKEAFANHLAYWTAKDGDQMKRIFKNSKAFKVLENKNDIDEYICKAIENCKKVNRNKPKPIKSRYKVKSFEGVEAEEIEWLWYPYIPKNAITVIASDPGTGKTYLALNLAAVLSSGGYIDNPNSIFYGSNFKEHKIMFQSAEDSPSMLKNRLDSFKEEPNYKNIIMLEENGDPVNYKDKELKNFIIEHKPDVIIFDTLQAFLPPSTKGNDMASMREALEPLFYLCNEYKVTVILLAHNNKNSGVKAIHRVSGSMDIVGIARTVLSLVKDKDGSLINLCAVKSNVVDMKRMKTIQFHIDPKAGGLVFDGFSNFTVDEILESNNPMRVAPKKEEAKDYLLEILKNGPMLASEVIEKAEKKGIGKRTLEEARKDLKLKSKRYDFGGPYYWAITFDEQVPIANN